MAGIEYDENCNMKIEFPGTDDTFPSFLIYDFRGTEYLSRLFEFNLSLVSTSDVAPQDITGKNITVTFIRFDHVTGAEKTQRYFNGIVSSFTKLPIIDTGSGPVYHYKAVMVPKLWLLSRRTDSKIFQQERVLEIVETVLHSYPGLEFDMSSITGVSTYDQNYVPRDYCAQYRETDFNFISRLLEDEGIFYYFKHENDKHTMVIIDSSPPQLTSGAGIYTVQQFDEGEGEILKWEYTHEIRSVTCTLGDFDFKDSNNQPDIQSTADPTDLLDIYDYPGSYIKYDTDDRMVTGTKLQDLSHLRLEEEEAQINTITGSGTYQNFTSGYQFAFEDNTQNTLLTEITHDSIQAILYSGAPLEVDRNRLRNRPRIGNYFNGFTCMPCKATDYPFRPSRVTEKPLVRGPQTAIVVNASGKTTPTGEATDDGNVYTDGYGRVKVRFHWERPHTVKVPKIDPQAGLPEIDGDGYPVLEDKEQWFNSAWVRVSHTWAGQGWGSMHIPHVGQEVIVDFLEGDPDRPIITGRVYNEKNQPHNNTDDDRDTMKPSVNQHISGFRDEYGNKLIFDAKKDQERVVLKSPKHDSYLSLGEAGAELRTNADRVDRVLGSIADVGLGSKLEALFGLEAALKIAQSYEFAFGQVFELVAGNKIEFGFGTEFEYKITKDLKAVEGDIEHECKKDYKLTAGDGFCIMGGTRDEGSKNRSIINAFADGIMLSLGEEKETKTAKADLGKLTWGIFGVASLVGIIFAVVAKVFESVGEGTDSDIPKYGKNSFASLTAITALVQTIATAVVGFSARDSVEPSFHEEPGAVIGINKSGITFGIKPDLAETKTKLENIRGDLKLFKRLSGLLSDGLNFQKAYARKQSVDKLKDQEQEIWKEFIEKSLGEETIADSKIMMKNDGAININSNGEKKEISLSVGEKDELDARILIGEDGVAIEGGTSAGIIVEKDKDINIVSGGGA
ncbi:MAG: type VI secretion system tip protein TssI/VgrG, partial [Thermodesulfobacteriota bacterium]|nr:type VI secretion system tip protein TssI/VgrG [Thermodesulfobacteriota bacterium]